MLYTFFIYIIIYIFTCLFAFQAKVAYIKSHIKESHFFIALLVLFFAIIVGSRYNVGLDYEAYYDLVNGYNTFELERIEFFPHYLTLFVQYYSIPFYIWFMIMAGISIYFIGKVFRNDLVFLLPISILLYLLYYLDFNVNVVRQACAASIVLFSYSYIRTKELSKYVLFLVLAFFFHRSSLIALPLYWLISDNVFIKRRWQYAIFFLMTIFGSVFVSFFLDKTSSLWIAVGYMEQLGAIVDKEMLAESNTGYGIIMNFIRYSIFILFYNQVSTHFKTRGFDAFYKIFFVGICLYSTTMTDVMLSRVNMYFLIADVAVSSYMYYYMLKVRKKYQLLAFGLLLVQCFMAFQAQVITTGPWQFVKFL